MEGVKMEWKEITREMIIYQGTAECPFENNRLKDQTLVYNSFEQFITYCTTKLQKNFQFSTSEFLV